MDHYQGKWPFWINPRQAIIIPINESHVQAAESLQQKLGGDLLNSDESIAPLTSYNFYVDIDKRGETIGARTKEAIQKGYSYIILIGDKEITNGTFAVRTRDDRKVKNMTSEEIYDLFVQLEKTYK